MSSFLLGCGDQLERIGLVSGFFMLSFCYCVSFSIGIFSFSTLHDYLPWIRMPSLCVYLYLKA